MTTILKSKWYIVDLTTRRVVTDAQYDGFWQAIDAETERLRNESGRPMLDNFTAIRGDRILASKTWIVPEYYWILGETP